MNTKAKIMIRPTIEANSVEITITALRHYRDTQILSDTQLNTIGHIISVFVKEFAKIESGKYGAYIKEGTKARVNLTIDDFGGDSVSTGLSDKEKFARMSNEESAKQIQLVEDELMASLAGISLEEYQAGKSKQ